MTRGHTENVPSLVFGTASGWYPEFFSLEVRIQRHSSSVFPGMLPGAVYTLPRAKFFFLGSLQMNWKSRARSSQLLPVAIEVFKACGGDLSPVTYAMFLLILN